jgi:hypothetical protein
MILQERICFLIHGFCFNAILESSGEQEWLQPYLKRENAVAIEWRKCVASLGPHDALFVIPPGDSNALRQFSRFCGARLRERFFLLDAPMPETTGLWSKAAAASGSLQLPRNREEFDTELHSEACVRQLLGKIADSGYGIDPHSTVMEGWGASFEGCVTKYSLTLCHMLGLLRPPAVRFELTVPDAAFLLHAASVATFDLTNGLRVFVFQTGSGTVGLITTTAHAPGDQPLYASLPAELARAVVRSKQGVMLWPQAAHYELTAEAGYHEPPREIVTFQSGRLRVPVASGFVYRLAKAPAYIFAPEGITYERFCGLLRAAVI